MWPDLCHSNFSFVYFCIFPPVLYLLLPRYNKVQMFPHVRKKQNVTAVKRLPVHHHSADTIFWSFRIIGPILTQFENRVPPKPVLGGHGQCCTVTLLHMYSLNKTEYFRFFDVFLASRESSFRTSLVHLAKSLSLYMDRFETIL